MPSATYFLLENCITHATTVNIFLNYRRCDISVYNCTTGSDMSVTWNKFLKEGEKQYMKYPSTKMLWYPGGAMHRSYIVHVVYFLLLQMIPAILLDTVLYIRGKKTRLE